MLQDMSQEARDGDLQVDQHGARDSIFGVDHCEGRDGDHGGVCHNTRDKGEHGKDNRCRAAHDEVNNGKDDKREEE